MDYLFRHLRLEPDAALYIKDPQRSETGQALLRCGARLMAEGGIETFTLKKLSVEAGCTEATVYRYFGNKHQLLMYLMNLYWGWLLYHAKLETANLDDARMKLQRIIRLLSGPLPSMPDEEFANDLFALALSEGVKTHLNYATGSEWKQGLFEGYERFAAHVEACLREYAPDYAYPMAWSATFIDAAMQQQFFLRHLPHFTELATGCSPLENFLMSLIPTQETKVHG
jgi:AcrR family transcriptional regulator